MSEDDVVGGQNVISMDKYIGVKEMLRKAEQRLAEANVSLEDTKTDRDTFKKQVTDLTDKFAPYVSPEDHKKVFDELETKKSAELDSKRSAFAEKYKLDVATIKTLSEEQLKLVELGASGKPVPPSITTPEGTKDAPPVTTTTTPAGETQTIPPVVKPDLSAGGGSSIPLNAIDVCKTELEEIKRK